MSMTDEELASIITRVVAREVGKVKDAIEAVAVNVKDITCAFNDKLDLLENRQSTLKESIKEIKTNIDKSIDDLATGNSMTLDFAETINKDLSVKLEDMTDKAYLENKVYLQDELIRINDTVSNKLMVLKGDKGDDGKTGDQGIQGEGGNDGATIDHRGDYETLTKYKKLNIVSHNGSTFIAMEDTTLSPPSNSWKILGAKGAKGNKGSQGERGLQGVKGERGLDGVSPNHEDMLAIMEDVK